MGSFIDLTGEKFGRLTVLNKSFKRGNNWYWHCICECGNEKDIDGRNLRGGHSNSCGCLSAELTAERQKKPTINLIGETFEYLTVIDRAGSDNRGEAKWLCQCECGNTVIVLGSNLRTGHTQSCGCMRYSHGEQKIINILNENNIKYQTGESLGLILPSGYAARFDFYINNQYVIEYDGETHYCHNLHGWHNKEQLDAQQERDNIKTKYCLDNNIPLIRIPYWHYNELCLQDLLLETTKFKVGGDVNEE